MPIRVRVIRKGKKLETVARDELINEKMTQEAFIQLGSRTKANMIAIIDRDRKSMKGTKTPNLTDSISFDINKMNILKGLSWGIGDTNILAQRVPYYLAINYGSRHRIPEITPKNASVLSWIGKDGQRVYAKSVKARNQIIPPMNYIEKTDRRLSTEIRAFKRIRRK